MRPTLAYLEVFLGTKEPPEEAKGSDEETADSPLGSCSGQQTSQGNQNSVYKWMIFSK